MNTVIVENDRSAVVKTSSDTTYDEIDNPTVCEPASNIETLDRKFPDEH